MKHYFAPLSIAIGVVAVGQVVLFIWLLTRRTFRFLGGDDIDRYHAIAHNLVHSNGFSRSNTAPFVSDTFNQPGYPFFVAGIYQVFGEGQRAVQFAQLALVLLIFMLVGLICRELKLSRSLTMTALVVALASPFVWLFSTFLLSETLATFALTLTVWSAVKVLNSSSARWWAVTGLLGGSCLLIRADLLISFALLATVLVTSLGRSQPKAVLAFAFAFVLALFPWTARNFWHSGEFRPLGGVADQVQSGYVHWLDTWLDHPDLIDPYWWRVPHSNPPLPKGKMPDSERREAEKLLAMARTERDTNRVDSGFATLATQARIGRPVHAVLWVPLKRVWTTWFELPDPVHSYRAPWGIRGSKLVAIYWQSITLLTVVGLCRWVRWHRPAFLLLGAVLVGRLALPLLSALAAEPRYMIESHPVLYIGAALGAHCIAGWAKELARSHLRTR